MKVWPYCILSDLLRHQQTNSRVKIYESCPNVKLPVIKVFLTIFTLHFFWAKFALIGPTEPFPQYGKKNMRTRFLSRLLKFENRQKIENTSVSASFSEKRLQCYKIGYEPGSHWSQAHLLTRLIYNHYLFEFQFIFFSLTGFEAQQHCGQVGLHPEDPRFRPRAVRGYLIHDDSLCRHAVRERVYHFRAKLLGLG